jgi:hypothetical protein
MNDLDKISGEENKKEVCKYLKDKATLQFLSDLLKPLLDVQDSKPILLRIGSTEPPIFRKFVPYLAFFAVDAAEGYTLCGTTPGLHKCRKCEHLTHVFNPNICPKARVSSKYEAYQRHGEQAWFKKVLKQPTTAFDNNILAKNKGLNISNVDNPLHAHFRHGNRNLFSSVPFDTLHTVLKGLLQQVFMWTLSVIQIVSKLSPKGSIYKNPFKELDKRIADFPRLHSVCPWGPFK